MAVTVTYTYPVAGTVAPTAAQVVNTVKSTVIASADGDTTATITHNLGFSSAELAQGYPNVTILGLLAAAQLSLWVCTSKTANTVVLTKATTAGSGNAGAQIDVEVSRRFSATQ